MNQRLPHETPLTVRCESGHRKGVGKKLAVFGIVWLVARRPVLALLGWPLHILIDIR